MTERTVRPQASDAMPFDVTDDIPASQCRPIHSRIHVYMYDIDRVVPKSQFQSSLGKSAQVAPASRSRPKPFRFLHVELNAPTLKIVTTRV